MRGLDRSCLLLLAQPRDPCPLLLPNLSADAPTPICFLHVPAASMLGAIWRAVKAGCLLPLLRNEDVRMRICRAAGIAHATVSLGDLQGFALDAPEALANTTGRAEERVSGVTSGWNSDVGDPDEAPASPRPSQAESQADSNQGPNSAFGGAGNTESVASTSLEEDEISMRPFLNTQSAVYRHRDPNSLDFY
jgi:hypothetical protein